MSKENCLTDSYTYSDGICTACKAKNCINCDGVASDEEKCNVCQSGYYLTSDNLCLKCDTNNPNNCQENMCFSNEPGKCYELKTTYVNHVQIIIVRHAIRTPMRIIVSHVQRTDIYHQTKHVSCVIQQTNFIVQSANVQQRKRRNVKSVQMAII